jgi:hypothetical protein
MLSGLMSRVRGLDPQRQSEQKVQRQLHRDVDRNFDRVMTDAGADVDMRVGMVHRMHEPEPPLGVKQPVGRVGRQIHDDQGHDELRHQWQRRQQSGRRKRKPRWNIEEPSANQPVGDGNDADE